LSRIPALISLALSLALASSGFCNSLQKRNLKLEARVGIGRQMPVFRPKTTIFAEQFQYNPSLFGLTRLNSLTEDFTEDF
jgi:hypothetical protein